MGATNHDLGPLGGLTDLHDVRLEARIGLRTFEGHLLSLRQQGLNPAQVQQGVPGVGLLNHSGDDVSLAAGVLLVLLVTLGLPDPLGEHLAYCLGKDTAEVFRRDVELVPCGLPLLIEVLSEHTELHGVGVDGHPRELMGSRPPLVGRFHSVGQCGKQGIDGNATLGRYGLHRLRHVGGIHDPTFLPGAASALRSFPLRADFGSGVHVKTVRAFKISS